jgi:hypothetical protein
LTVVSDAGRGRLFLDPAKQHDDLRLLRYAIKKRWEIPEEFRGVIVGRLREIVEHGDDEIALKAIAEARQIEAQNQKDEHKIVDVSISNRHAELDAIAADLGLDVGLIEAVARKTSGGDSVAQERSDEDSDFA